MNVITSRPFSATLVTATLGGAVLVGSYSLAVSSATHLTEVGPAGAPFAHTRFCLRYPGECRIDDGSAAAKTVALTPERRAELAQVNAKVNRDIVEKPDREQPAFENWLINPASGDCNDYAVTKRHILAGKGWPESSLRLTEVKLPDNEHHLVLIARTTGGDIVLDNLKSKLRTVAEATDYQWLRMESGRDPRFWSRVKAPS